MDCPAGERQLTQHVIVAQGQARLLDQGDSQPSDQGGVGPEKGRPGADPPTAGDGLRDDLADQSRARGVRRYLHLQ